MASLFKKMAQPIARTQVVEELLTLTPKVTECLKIYVGKQVELAELIHQKIQFLTLAPERSSAVANQATELNREIKELAKELLNESSLQTLLKQPVLTSLQQQGGFLAIHERLQQNEMVLHDILTVLRYAQRNVHQLSQSLSHGQEFSYSGKYR